MHGNGEGELLRRLESFFPPPKIRLILVAKGRFPRKEHIPGSSLPIERRGPECERIEVTLDGHSSRYCCPFGWPQL